MAIQSIETVIFITAEQRRAILYDNAARLLVLREEEIAEHHISAAR
ncbi:MAG: hypothetical protein ACREK2_00835 [Gemmatimonadota bacterium]